MKEKSIEQQARDMLERAGVEKAQSMTAGDLTEICDLIEGIAQYESLYRSMIATVSGVFERFHKPKFVVDYERGVVTMLEEE